jgi:hypothetical protein
MEILNFVKPSNGSGNGYGDGSGSGYGYGYGDGNGFGLKKLNGEDIHMIDEIPTIIRKVKGNIAKGAMLLRDMTLQPCYVVKQGDLFAHGENLHEAQEALIAKVMEDMPEEEQIEMFWKEFKRGVKYSATKFFDWHQRLTGSCEMGRKQFVKEHDIDLETDKYTVAEFIELTKESYGGNIIKKLKEEEE